MLPLRPPEEGLSTSAFFARLYPFEYHRPRWHDAGWPIQEKQNPDSPRVPVQIVTFGKALVRKTLPDPYYGSVDTLLLLVPSSGFRSGGAEVDIGPFNPD